MQSMRSLWRGVTGVFSALWILCQIIMAIIGNLFLIFGDNILVPILYLSKSLTAFLLGKTIVINSPFSDESSNHSHLEFLKFVPKPNWPSWATIFGHRLLPIYGAIILVIATAFLSLKVFVCIISGGLTIFMGLWACELIIVPALIWIEEQEWCAWHD